MWKWVIGLVGLNGIALGQPNEADQLLRAMSSKYQKLTEVEMTADREDQILAGQRSQASTVKYELAARGREKIRVRQERPGSDVLIVSDGTQTWRALGQEKRWTRQEAARVGDVSSDEGSAAEEIEEADLARVVQRMLIRRPLILGHRGQHATTVKDAEFKTAKGKVTCRVVRLELDNSRYELWIGREEPWLWQSIQTNKQISKMGPIETRITIRMRSIEDRAGGELFAFAPKPGWKEVDMLAVPGEETLTGDLICAEATRRRGGVAGGVAGAGGSG